MNVCCVILDSASVRIGDHSMIGLGAQILFAEPHRTPQKRRAGIEIARQVRTRCNVWIGAAAVPLPEMAVGDGAIIGAGVVMTRNVAAGQTVTGIAARPIRGT